MALRNPSAEVTSSGSHETPTEVTGFVARLRAVLTGDVFVNLLIVCSLVVGFCHGWLKLKIRSPFTTFAFDVFVILALFVVYLRAGTLRRFFPEGATSRALFGFYALCLLYMPLSFLPGMPPFVVALSTLRGWVFASLLYGLGYQIIRNRSQVHGYFLLILFLGLATAIYGIRQSDAEVLQMMKDDPYFARRYRGQGYVDAEGDYHVRRFSTFVSSGAFGGSMATLIIFGTALILAPGTRKWERGFLAVILVPIGYGMLLSGARSAAITAGLGVLILMLARRQFASSLAILAVAAAGTFLAAQATGGGVFDRLSTLNFKNLFYRFWWPTETGLVYMSDHPLGGGIGKTGFRPGFLRGADEYVDYLSPDGDLGRLMVEFGVLGLIFFGRVIYFAAKRMYAITLYTLRTDSSLLVLGSATNLWLSIAFLGVGSPFIGVPMGVLVWFFFGASERLLEIESAQRPAAAALPGSGAALPTAASAQPLLPASVSGNAPRASRRFLYAGPESQPAETKPTVELLTDESDPAGTAERPTKASTGSSAESSISTVIPGLPAVTRKQGRKKVFLYAGPKRSEREQLRDPRS